MDRKKFLYPVIRYKKPMFMPIVFLSLFFHLLTYTNPNILIDAKQLVLTLFLLRLFEPYVFYNHRITQKIYLHYHHHPNDYHHHHNNHHATYLPPPLSQTNQGQTAKKKSLFYCLSTHFLCLKIIRNIPQDVWKLSHCFITHFWRFKTVRNKF